MLIGDYLHKELGIGFAAETFAQLNQLAGIHIDEASFLTDMRAVQAIVHARMPIYFFPILQTTNFLVGFYLHPAYIHAQKLPVAGLSDHTQLVELGSSLTDYICRLLLDLEAYHHEDGDDPEEEMAEVLRPLQSILGSDFFTLGMYGEEFYTDNVAHRLIEEDKASVRDYYLALRRASVKKNPAALDQIQRASKKFSPSLYLQARLVELLAEENDFTAMEAVLTKAMFCYAHTEYRASRSNLQIQSRAVAESLKLDYLPFLIPTLDMRVQGIVYSYQHSDLETAVRLVDDLCYDICSYDYPLALQLLTKLYGELGWGWALSLLKLRGTSTTKAQALVDNQLGVGWDSPLKALLH